MPKNKTKTIMEKMKNKTISTRVFNGYLGVVSTNFVYRVLLCLFLFALGNPVCAQSDAPKVKLSKMKKKERNAYLLEKSKEVIMNFGPRFYREYGEPEISGRKKYKIKGNDIYDRPAVDKFVGKGYYTVTFRYDMEEEIFAWDYAAVVEIWDDGEPKTVKFGEGYGTYFYEESYKDRLERGLRESEIFDYDDEWIEERKKERQRTRELLGL